MWDAISFFFIDNFYDYLFCNMVIFGIKMTAIKFPIEWWDLISKMLRFEFLVNFFHHFYIHIWSPWPWPLTQIGTSVWLEFCSQEIRTHRQTDTQTNCSENITPPRFRGGVKKKKLHLSYKKILRESEHARMKVLLIELAR